MAGAFAIAAAGVRALAPNPRLARARSFEDFRGVIAQCLAEEAERGRIALWAPVAFAGGVLLYFALPREPSLLALLALVGLLACGAFLVRRSNAVGILTLGMALVAAGLTIAKVRTDLIAAPVIPDRYGPAVVKGTVYSAERRESGVR